MKRAWLAAPVLTSCLVWLACSDSPLGPTAGGEIDENGGEVTAPGVVLSVPPGALPGPSRITVRSASPAELPASVGPRRDSIVPGTLFEFGPDGLTFDPPAVITLEYDPADLPPGTDEARLGVARIDSVLTVIPVAGRDTSANTVSAEVDHFTFFGLVLPDLTLDLTIDVVVEETIFVTDELPIESTPPLNVVVEETITVTDELPIEATPPLNLVVEESIAVLDEVPLSDLVPVRIEVLETVGVADVPGSTVTGLPTATADVGEAITVADAVTVDAPGVVRIDVTEAVGVADVPSPTPVEQPSVDVLEAVAVTDVPVVTAPGVVRIDVTESVGVADAPSSSVAGPAVAEVTEAIAVSDVPDLRVLSPTTLYVGSGLAEVGVFDPDLSSITSVAVPGQVGYVARRPGTSDIWVAERGTDSLVVVNGATNTRVAAAYSGTLDPFAIDFDATGTIAAIADNDADRLTIFDAASLTQSGLTVRNSGVGRLSGVQLSSDGATAWVVGENVARVDVTNRVPLDTAEVGGITYASDVDLTQDESELWVTDGLSGNIVIYDAATLAILDTVPVSAGTTTGGEKLTLSDDGTTAFATTATFGELVVIDVATRGELTRYAIGSSTSNVVYDPERAVVYLTSIQPDDELIRFDLATATVTGRVTFTSPRGLVLLR